MSNEPAPTGSMVQIQVQLGVLQGTINTLLTALGNRVTGTEEATKQLRVDLTAVKDKGIESLNDVKNSVTQNSSAIVAIRADVEEVRKKQDGTVGRAVLIISPAVAVLSLLWAVFGGK